MNNNYDKTNKLPTSMKRVEYSKFGGPEVLEIKTVPIPTPQKNEVLVKMLATSVNGGDLGVRGGKLGVLSKFAKFPKSIGIDVVGIVQEIGANVTDLKIGDYVWGNAGPKSDATAEYITIKSEYVSLAPQNIEPTVAASFVTVGITALTALRKGKIKKGDDVLIRGVGLIGVQIAKALGTTVSTLSSPVTVESVKEYGADHVFDYKKTFSDDLGKYDVVLDTVGKGVNEFHRNLKKNGRLVTVDVAGALNLLPSMIYGKHRTRLAIAYATKERLDFLAKLVEANKIKPMMDSVYPMEDIVEAHRRAEMSGILGKVVISISQS